MLRSQIPKSDDSGFSRQLPHACRLNSPRCCGSSISDPSPKSGCTELPPYKLFSSISASAFVETHWRHIQPTVLPLPIRRAPLSPRGVENKSNPLRRRCLGRPDWFGPERVSRSEVRPSPSGGWIHLSQERPSRRQRDRARPDRMPGIRQEYPDRTKQPPGTRAP
jgi:hypothetical protein